MMNQHDSLHCDLLSVFHFPVRPFWWPVFCRVTIEPLRKTASEPAPVPEASLVLARARHARPRLDFRPRAGHVSAAAAVTAPLSSQRLPLVWKLRRSRWGAANESGAIHGTGLRSQSHVPCGKIALKAKLAWDLLAALAWGECSPCLTTQWKKIEALLGGQKDTSGAWKEALTSPDKVWFAWGRNLGGAFGIWTVGVGTSADEADVVGDLLWQLEEVQISCTRPRLSRVLKSAQGASLSKQYGLKVVVLKNKHKK